MAVLVLADEGAVGGVGHLGRAAGHDHGVGNQGLHLHVVVMACGEDEAQVLAGLQGRLLRQQVIVFRAQPLQIVNGQKVAGAS